jgi:cation diffusion facilitator family transporter
MSSAGKGMLITLGAAGINSILAVVKVATGLVGHSQALIADGIESTMDIVSSCVVWNGLRVSVKPPDQRHPYGHGKAESLSGMVAAAMLILAAGIIANNSIREILRPTFAPAPYTALVLVGTILIKETLYRIVIASAISLDSVALRTEAWHHRSDALTSLAALVGIVIAIAGGPGYEAADDWAALLACGVIAFNGVRLLLPAVNEVMDEAVSSEVEDRVRQAAGGIAGVTHVEKCRIRRSGLGLLMDIHIGVDGDLSVRAGHAIGHDVKSGLLASDLGIIDVVVHVEPDGADG